MMNYEKKLALKACDDYYFKRLILSYLQPSKWEEAIKKSTEISEERYNGILNYRNAAVINRTIDFDLLELEDVSLTQEMQYTKRRRQIVRVYINQCLEEIDKVIKLELSDISEEELSDVKSEVFRLQSRNETTIETVNFKMLNSKYKSLFTEKQFTTIIKYPYIQDALVSLDDSELKCFEIAFKAYLKKESLIIEEDEQSEWNFKMEEYIASLMSEQYRKIILEISQLKVSEEQEMYYTLMASILDKPNYYNIQNLNDLKNLSETKKDLSKKIMSYEDISEYPLLSGMSEIEKYRFVGLQHLGFYPCYEMANMFDSTVAENLEDKYEWILRDLAVLKKLYTISNEAEMKSFVTELGSSPFVSEEKTLGSLFRLLIKVQMEKSINMGITEISKLPRMKETEKKKFNLADYKGIIYDATDTDFSFIVSSVSPYTEYKPEKIPNYKEYWEANDLSEVAGYSHICPRNLIIASLKTANLGFNQIRGLTYMSPFDSDSKLANFTPKADNIGFMSVNRLADYQELTEINSKRAKPDYIPLIKCWGEITNLEEAIQAADDFSEEASQMPIVFMDWDKIRYEQAKENVKLISNYQKKTDRRMLKQIAQNMVFYQIADHEIYGHYLTYNKISECLGNNSDEFSDYVKGLDLRNIVWYINYYMDYVKENNIQVTLEEMIGEEPEGR